MNIRLAQPSDAQALSHLLANVWKTAYRGIFPQHFLDNLQEEGWTSGFQDTIKKKQSTIFIAEIKGKIIGMVAFGKARDPELQLENEIYALNVLPDFQHQNIGTTLMNYLFDNLKLQNQSLYLKVAKENISAQSFYLKLGFQNTKLESTRKIADFTFQEWIFKH